MAGAVVTRLVFSREPQSVPFDLDGQLTEWRPATAYGEPDHGIDTRYVGHGFAGNAGYVAVDRDRQLIGRDAITVLAIVTPDYGAHETMCIIGRGEGGASPDRYHGYEFGLNVRATDIGLYHRYQDSTGAEHQQEIATIGRPPKFTALVVSWCRERDRLCAFVNGDQVGEVTLAGAGPVITLDVPVTIGCQATVAGYKRHFRGVLQYLEVQPEAVTAASERHRFERLWRMPEQWGDIAESLLLPLPGRNYRAVRRATLGTVMGACAADIARAESGMSPASAYGPALQRWEHAAGLRPPPTATIADRQIATTAALRSPRGFSVPELQAYAAQLMGVDTADVAIVEGSNQLELPCASDGLIPGPWRATGVGHAFSDAHGLHLRGRASDDLRFAGFNQHGIQLAVAIPQGHKAFAVILDQFDGTSEHAWAGIVLRTHTECIWLAVYAKPGGYQLAWRGASVGGLGPWTELATLVGDIELSIECIDGTWVTRAGTTTLPLTDAPADWIGVALGADAPLVDDLACRITSANLLCGDAPVHWQWTAVCDSPRYWRDEHVALLNRRSRASAQAFISRAPIMRCDDPKSQLSRTPLAASTTAQLLPEHPDDVYRILGMRPRYLLTYEGTELREHLAGLEVLVANPHLLAETTGPDGRPAVAYDPLAFHYTAAVGLLPFVGEGFAVAMVCKLDGTPGRILSQWQPSPGIGFHLDYLASGFLRLTTASPTVETACQLYIGDRLDTWTAITLAIQRIAGRWHCTLAVPTKSVASQLDGTDFTPAARLSVNRLSSDLGTAMTCRWLAIFDGDQIGDYLDPWQHFTRLIARAAHAL